MVYITHILKFATSDSFGGDGSHMASHHKPIMEKTCKFEIVYAGPTNLCRHSTTDLARGIMTNDGKQSVLSKV